MFVHLGIGRLYEVSHIYWDIYLPVIVNAYNTTVTGYSPFFIVHEREARRPTEKWMEDYVDQLHDRTLAESQQVMLETAADRKMHSTISVIPN
jgi:hypothetical protein